MPAQPPVPTPADVINGDGIIYGTDANDQINAGNNTNIILAGGGDDLVYGGSGDDTIYGGDGNDYLYGSAGNNALYGQGGNDVLYGGSGNDLLVGGPGDDTMYGGGGSNTAVFEELYHAATITNGGSEVIGPDGDDTIYQIGTLRFLDGTTTTDTGSDVAQIYRLYQAAFARAPDAVGLSFFTAQLDAGIPLPVVAQSFLASPEFQARYSTGGDVLSNGQYVDQLYQNVLGRSSGTDPSGAAYWQQQLDTGALTQAQVLTDFSESPENVQNTASVFANGMFVPSNAAIDVLAAYKTILGHAPDAAGLAYWSDQLENGGLTTRNLASSLIGSAEFQAGAGAAASDNTAFAGLVANNAEGSGQSAAANYWAGQLNAGVIGKADVATAYIDAPEIRANVVPALAGGYAVS